MVHYELPFFFSFVTQSGRKRIHSENYEDLQNCHSTLVANIARTFYWQSLIDDGKYENMKELAKALGLENGAVTKVVRLTLLSSKIIHKIIIGDITINSNILNRKNPATLERPGKAVSREVGEKGKPL